VVLLREKEPNSEKKVLVIRGMKVMLDRDLAELYDVETRRLKEQESRAIPG
jgi:ORF6N domain